MPNSPENFHISKNRFSSPKLSLAARFLLILQKIYKLTLSPFIGRSCRYLPTCSDYAAECVKLHGAWRGSWLGLARLCRCHPWGQSGFDPAPKTIANAKWYRPWDYGIWKINEQNDFNCKKIKENV